MTYREIYEQFLDKCNTDVAVADYRPASGMFIDGIDNNAMIPNAIMIWLKDGSKIIYIAEV